MVSAADVGDTKDHASRKTAISTRCTCTRPILRVGFVSGRRIDVSAGWADIISAIGIEIELEHWRDNAPRIHHANVWAPGREGICDIEISGGIDSDGERVTQSCRRRGRRSVAASVQRGAKIIYLTCNGEDITNLAGANIDSFCSEKRWRLAPLINNANDIVEIVIDIKIAVRIQLDVFGLVESRAGRRPAIPDVGGGALCAPLASNRCHI